jgi:hypothetical protein
VYELCGLEYREYGCEDSLRWPRDTLYPQKLALTSPTSSSFACRLKSWSYIIMYNLNYTPTTLGVQGWREITYRGHANKKGWVPPSLSAEFSYRRRALRYFVKLDTHVLQRLYSSVVRHIKSAGTTLQSQIQLLMKFLLYCYLTML